jgi:hypothetical protein
MMFRIRLFRGLRHPGYFTYELKTMESVGTVWRQVVTLILLSGLISGISASFGIGSEYLSTNLVDTSEAEFAMQKALFVIGQVLWGLFYGTVMIYLSSLWFWSLTDTEMNRFVVVQMMVLIILLIEKLLLIPVSLVLGVPEVSSPFSLGPLVQTFTSHGFLVHFFAGITLFKLWAMWIQYIYVRALTEKSRAVVLGLVIGLNLLFWLFSAFFSIIQFEKLI